MTKTLVTLKNGRQKLVPTKLADSLVRIGRATYADAPAAAARTAAPKATPTAAAAPKAPAKTAKKAPKAPAKKTVAKPMTYGRRDMRATKKGK